MAGSALYALDVHIHWEHVLVECKAPDSCSRVWPDSGELGEIVRPAIDGDALRCSMQVQRSPVVAEPLPLADHIRCRGRCQRIEGRPAIEPGDVPRDDSPDRRLLKHDLADEDRVRISRAPPRKVATRCLEPGEEQRLYSWDAMRPTRIPRPRLATGGIVVAKGGESDEARAPTSRMAHTRLRTPRASGRQRSSGRGAPTAATTSSARPTERGRTRVCSTGSSFTTRPPGRRECTRSTSTAGSSGLRPIRPSGRNRRYPRQGDREEHAGPGAARPR